jgi:hypothetical protein
MSLGRRAVALSAPPNWREHGTPEPHGEAMAKLTKMPADSAAGLTVRERVLSFCAASGTDWHHVDIPGETVTTMMVKGFIYRDPAGMRRGILAVRGKA